MYIRGLVILLLCIIFLPTCRAADSASQPALNLFSRESAPKLEVALPNSAWRWLGKKRVLRIAIAQPTMPPFDMLSAPDTCEGITADYLSLITRNLGLIPQVTLYRSRDAALAAIAEGKADLLADNDGALPPEGLELTASRSYIANTPALVGLESRANRPIPTTQALRLAVAEGYLADSVIKAHYPQAVIQRFPSNQSAISSVVAGKTDYFIGNFLTANFLIERNYINTLSVVALLPNQPIGSRFIVRKRDRTLLLALNAALHDVSSLRRNAIIQQWLNSPDLTTLRKPLKLTAQEQRWLQQHPQLRVVINPFYGPFTTLDEHHNFSGISADLLRLIHLRTGMNFKPVIADSVGEMVELLDADRADFLAAISYSVEREQQLIFTRPYLQTPFVLVVRNGPGAPKDLNNSLTLAVVDGNSMQAAVARRYPGIRWVKVANASLAMQQVSEGSVDGAIHNQLGVNYMLESYFRGQLKIALRLDESPAWLGFATRRNAPELSSILNKALADIPPSDISHIINKWQAAPKVHLETWRLYSARFYGIAILALLLVVVALCWVLYLRRQARVRQQTQTNLLAQLKFRDTLLNGAPRPIYVINRQGEIISSNKAFSAFFARVPPEHLQLPLFDQRHPLANVLPTLMPLMDDAPPPMPEALTRTLQLYDGAQQRTVSHWCTVYTDNHDAVAGLICGWQDITEHKNLLLELQAEKENADKASRAKSAFLATMSHEIRTPISAIIGLLELVRHDRKKRITHDDDDEAIRLAYTSAQSLLGLIGDILDMAKIESGNLDLLPDWVDPDTLLVETVQIFQALAANKQLTLQYHSLLPADQEIWVDQQRLRQVLSNYLSNAIKFTERGEVNVYAEAVPAGDSERQITLILRVQDSGIGISSNERQRLFQPFSQLEAGKMQTGTGLGLAISKELLAKMHGTMTLDSQTGQGTTVTVRLTVPARSRVPDTSAHNTTASAQARLKILIVDDHATNRLLLRRQLHTLGHAVDEATDGEKAFALWQSGHYDLVITDCNMPVMDGFTLTKRIRATNSAVAIWGLTANAQPQERVRCQEAGMDDCLFKPLRLPQLEEMLATLASRSPAAAPLDTLIDLPALQKLAMNNTAFLQQMLQRAQEDNRQDLAQAAELCQRQDWAALAICAHRLTGSAQIIAAEALIPLYERLEAACRHAPDADDIQRQLLTLSEKNARLEQAITAFIGRLPQE
ncbi:transporter substrate-binding domain-containing protein [Serratia rubidaea]|uniref:response regulator n=1 Tax=Serratia rubidaea TaxID=61652 RepID=UPI001F199392|nr:transporter substrate-binding domain-containing protein [Serratia rubidaea]UJD81803.1 transporter substrate-binding domain-containing protein [Serratia rubidaea]UJD86366.1 transporter substrate-binding domain-containing protein [Serratia rubidaea]